MTGAVSGTGSGVNDETAIPDEAVEAAAKVIAERQGGWTPPGWWHEKTAREALAAAAPALVAAAEAALRSELAAARADNERMGAKVVAAWHYRDEAYAERETALAALADARRALERLAQRGTHTDLMPTVNGKADWAELYTWFCGYLQRADENVREIARDALAACSSSPAGTENQG